MFAYPNWLVSLTAFETKHGIMVLLSKHSVMTLRTYLVEDNFVIRENLVGFLEELADAAVVSFAATESEAVEWLHQNAKNWDVAIVDLFLTQGNGLGVIDALKDRNPHQKVVVLTNYAINAMRARSMELGADAFFDKSAEIEELLLYCEQLGEQKREWQKAGTA